MYKSTTKKHALVHAFFVTGNLLFFYFTVAFVYVLQSRWSFANT